MNITITIYPQRHIFRYTFIMFFSVILGLILISFATADENCTQLLKERCETCHYLTRVCQKVDREINKKRWFGNAEGPWKRTIRNMVKQGAVLSDAEEKILVECMGNPTSEVLALCKLKK